jgi:hypothetical protein
MPKRPRRASAPRQRRRPSIETEVRQIRNILERRLEIIDDLQRTCSIQFQRIAQIQAELDQLKRAWARLQLPDRD